MNRGPRVTPFRVGGPIRDPADFAGREEVLQQIAHAMLNLQNVSLHGERRTGKTSVLLYLAHPASDTRLPETHIPVYFSFQDLAEASIVEVWQALADAVAAQIEQRHPDRQADSQRFLATTAEFLASSKAPALFGTGFGRALAQLEESGFRVHLLFDEFDQTARNPNLGDPFYDALRSLPIRAENISYVIASRTGLAALQPIYSKVSSPFFNIFTTIVLAPFREDEVHRLIFDYFARAGLDLSLAEELCTESAFLYDVTGYHPFFLQTLCYHLCAGLDKPEWPRGEAQQEALRAFETDSESHFDYYWEVSSRGELELIEKLATGQSVDWGAPGNAAKSLEDRCLIVPVNGSWRLFSSVFAKWVEKEKGYLASLYHDARSAERAGRRGQAIRLYARIVSQDDSYFDAAQRLVRLREHEDLEKLRAQGEGLVQKEKWGEASKIYELILAREPDHPGAARRLAYVRRQFELAHQYTRARAELEKGDLDKAIQVLEDITSSEPSYKEAAVLLAGALRQQRLIQLRQEAERAIGTRQWSEAERLLEKLTRSEHGDRKTQQQYERVRQWRKLEEMYWRGERRHETREWDETIARVELLVKARTNEHLDVLRKKCEQLEAAGNFELLIQLLDEVLGWDPTSQEVRAWKESALQQMRLKNLYNQASSRMKQRDWAGAKRLLDEIASIDVQFRDVQAMRAQVTLGRGVNLMRRWGFPLVIVLGVGLLVVFTRSLITEGRPPLDVVNLAITNEFLGSVVSVFGLIASIIGLLAPREKLYELLERHTRLRAYAILVVLLVIAVLLTSLLMNSLYEIYIHAYTNELCNGSFEEGWGCWEKGGDLRRTRDCSAGLCFAVLGDPDYACEGGVPVGEAWIKQSFKVPETVSPTLSLRYRVFSYDLDSFDFFQVTISGKSIGEFGNTEWDKSDCSREVWDSGWRSVEFDLSPYKGQRLEVSFHNVNGTHAWWNTWTYVDNVEIR